MDIFSTQYLNGVVATLKRVPSLFLTSFFPTMQTSTTEEIYFDVVEDKPRITPFVHPLVQGKQVESLGYATKSFKPAYAKDLRVFNPNKTLKRLAGEAIGGSMNPANRLNMLVAQDLADMNRMYDRRLEVMAAEAIIDGKQTIIGEGVSAVLDFGRHSDLTVGLTAGDKWDAVGSDGLGTADIPTQLETWSAKINSLGGTVQAIIMDSKAWALFRKNKFVISKDTGLLRLEKGDTSSLIISPEMFADGEVQYKGSLGNFPIYVYQSVYVKVDGSAGQIMPDNTVVLASRAVEGVRHFGAIMDIDALVPMERYVKSWTENNPSVRMMLLQSAPLMVPYRTNSSMKVTVA